VAIFCFQYLFEKQLYIRRSCSIQEIFHDYIFLRCFFFGGAVIGMTVNVNIHGSGFSGTWSDSVMVLIRGQYQHIIVVHFEDLIFKTDLPFAIYHIDKIMNDHISCGVHTRLVKKAKVG
jgi:hypothetical protein